VNAALADATFQTFFVLFFRSNEGWINMSVERVWFLIGLAKEFHQDALLVTICAIMISLPSLTNCFFWSLPTI